MRSVGLEAFQAVNTQFEFESLILEQQKAILKSLFFEGNVFVNLLTGFGKIPNIPMFADSC